MSPLVLTYAPLMAIAAVLVAVLLAAGIYLGFSGVMIVMGLLAIMTVGLAWMVWKLTQQLAQKEQTTRQARLISERIQSMLGVMPGGYCLLTPQGLLREVVRVPQILGVEKITHIDDVIAALKDVPEFINALRRLQQTGESFNLAARTAKESKSVQIAGRRFRVGREGPMVDVVWFNLDHAASVVADQQTAELSVAVNSARATQAMINLLPFPVWARTKELNLVMVNAAYARALDLPPEEALSGQHELTTQAARGGSGRALAASALSSGTLQRGRRHVVISGKRHLFEIVEIPFTHDGDNGGDASAASNNMALFGFAIDVSVEEEKEDALQRHINAEHEVLENLGSAIAIYGADMRMTFYNRAYLRLWEGEEAFLDSKPTFGEVLEDLRSRRRAPEQADFQRYKKDRVALFTSLLEPREDLMHLPDGTTLRILAAPHPLGGLVFVHEDVTDKLALESSYNTLIAVQRETLDNLAEGIGVFGSDGKLRLFNPAFAGIWKLSPEYLMTNPHISDLLERMKGLFSFGNNWAQFKNEMVEYTLDRNPRCGRIERADNAVIEYNTIPLPDGAVLNSYLDVTDSVKVEQALRASNAALAAADRLKSEFVANVSYQLRTPLNTIMGFAEILTNQYFGTLNERQVEYARTIMDASKKLLLLINDVLDLATIEAGRMVLERKTLNAADVLNSVKMITAEWARQQSLEMVIDCPSDIGTFDADEQRVKQSLFNLVSNAVKYTPAGGRITLQARRNPEWMALSVIDSGIGIPEADRDRVFGKFERANTQARQSGAGLGLSLVKSFIELHGGRIEMSSEVGKGTRVTCFIPLKGATLQAIPDMTNVAGG